MYIDLTRSLLLVVIPILFIVFKVAIRKMSPTDALPESRRERLFRSIYIDSILRVNPMTCRWETSRVNQNNRVNPQNNTEIILVVVAF